MSCRRLRGRRGVRIRTGGRNRLCRRRGIGKRGRSRRRCGSLLVEVGIVEVVGRVVALDGGRSRSFGVVVGMQHNSVL